VPKAEISSGDAPQQVGAMPSQKCVHLLDDSTVPGYAIVCLWCNRLWRHGPRAGAYQWAEPPLFRLPSGPESGQRPSLR
jgi:hypothetical protein